MLDAQDHFAIGFILMRNVGGGNAVCAQQVVMALVRS
jgi:hypothetical protein